VQIVDQSAEEWEMLPYNKLQDLCGALRECSGAPHIALNSKKMSLCAYVKTRQLLTQVQNHALQLQQYDLMFMATCRTLNDNGIRPVLLKFSEYILRNFFSQDAKYEQDREQHYLAYVQRQECAVQDKTCRDCATIQYVLTTEVARMFIQLNQSVIDDFVQFVAKTTTSRGGKRVDALEILVCTLDSLLSELKSVQSVQSVQSLQSIQSIQFRGLRRQLRPLSPSIRELLLLLLMVFVAILTYTSASSTEATPERLRALPESLYRPSNSRLISTPAVMLSDNYLVVGETNRCDLEQVVGKSLSSLAAARYWLRRYPSWVLYVDDEERTLVPINYARFEYLDRVALLIRSELRNVYIRNHEPRGIQWLQLIAMTLSVPRPPPATRFVKNRSGFGRHHTDAEDYLTMVRESGNFLHLSATERSFIAPNKGIRPFSQAFRDRMTDYYYSDQVGYIRHDTEEQTDFQVYSTTRLYLINFSTALHVAVAESDDLVGLKHVNYEDFQAHTDLIWFTATQQWFSCGSTEYLYLRSFLIEAYGDTAIL